MSETPPPSPSGYVIPPRYWAWLGTRRAAAALLWAAAVVCGSALLYHSMHWFDNRAADGPERARADGNSGHVQIDFGGQWVMGRMVATGNGRQLYHRQKQWQVVREAYPIEDEAPIQREEAPLPKALRTKSRPNEDWQHDSTNLMNWFMGSDNDPKGEWKTVAGASVAPLAQPLTGNPLLAAALEKAAADAVTPEVVARANEPSVGGPLYPPVHALFYAPLGTLRAQTAYHLFQVFCALLVPVTALGVKLLSRGRIWWSAATLFILFYPGMRGGLDLGQNPVLSLCIVVWGWALASRGYNVAGGMVWGLLAFKPVWAAAFFLVPLLSGRWRFCAAMLLTGAAFGLITLPVVGIDAWFDWLKVGKEANDLYKVNSSWIHLSRDLQGLPRRMFADFSKPESEHNPPLINAMAWGLWGAVLAATAVVYLARADRRRATGRGAGFLFLGAFLTCLHFMYYDALISAAAVAVLFADPRRLVETRAFAVEPAAPDSAAPPRPLAGRVLAYVNSFPLTVVVALFVVENSLMGMEFEATVGVRALATLRSADSTSTAPPRVQGDTSVKYPLDTFLLLTLWGWCGWRLLRGGGRRDVSATPGTHTDTRRPSSDER